MTPSTVCRVGPDLIPSDPSGKDADENVDKQPTIQCDLGASGLANVSNMS